MSAVIRRRQWLDFVLVWTLRGLASLAGLLLLLIVGFVVAKSLPALRTIGLWRFFTDPAWRPSQGEYNATPMIAATLLATLGAIAWAGPWGIAVAVFARWYAPPWLGNVLRRTIELAAGTPSVVFGFWGLVSLAPLIALIAQPGQSLLAGVLILGLMILPTVALFSDSALAATPKEQLLAAASLGLPRLAVVWKVAFPAARRGVFTGVLLAVTRALGETMAVLLVCGNVVQTPTSVFDSCRMLTANIALEMAYARDMHQSALFVTGLGLLVIVMALVAAAEVVSPGRLRA